MMKATLFSFVQKEERQKMIESYIESQPRRRAVGAGGRIVAIG